MYSLTNKVCWKKVPTLVVVGCPYMGIATTGKYKVCAFVLGLGNILHKLVVVNFSIAFFKKSSVNDQ